jgi:hypothetical protein
MSTGEFASSTTRQKYGRAQLSAVDYESPQIIKISDVFAWKLKGSTEAEKRVRDTYFFTKASPWQYEKEWRHIRSSTGADA